jgi:hypothetical protein
MMEGSPLTPHDRKETLMDDSRFDALARSLTEGRSRRVALGGLLIGTLGLLGVQWEAAEAHNPLKACKKKSGDAKKKCVKKVKKHNATHTSPPIVHPDAQCRGGSIFSGIDDSERWAQGFTVQRSGELVRAQLTFSIAQGTTGNLVAAIHALDGAGMPTNTALRSVAVATETLSFGEQEVGFEFLPSLPVAVGTSLALVFSHSGDKDPGVKRSVVDACAGEAYRSSGAASPFALESDMDFDYTIFIFA